MMMINNKLIFTVITACMQISLLSATWQFSITAHDADDIGAEHTIHLGTSDDWSDSWQYGEDEYDYPNPQGSEYTNIHFFHLDWSGTSDDEGNICCDQIEFSSDKRASHPPDELISWGIRGSTGGGLDPNIPINLSWDVEAVDSLSDNYQLYLYVGDIGYDMRQLNSVTVEQTELNLDTDYVPNIMVLMGNCASGPNTYYLDGDNDGWGGNISSEFCDDYPPDGWVDNGDDVDDTYTCNANLIDDCNDCVEEADFNAAQDCAGVCDGSFIIVTLCEDTDGDGLGNPGSETEECVDGNVNACSMPDQSIHITSDNTVLYNTSELIGGFQFNVDGATVISANGGTAEDSGFMISNSSTTVYGFTYDGATATIPVGCGTLVVLSLDGDATRLSDITFGDPQNNNIPFMYYTGGETDFVADCSDEFPDCFDNYYDECGVCGGSGIPDGKCDCDGNELDCAGECGGSAIEDCYGECGGFAVVDECGVCGGPGTYYCGGGIYECNEHDCPDTIDYCLELHSGANLKSFYALPENTSVASIISSLGENATGIIGEGVSSIQISPGNWVGSLTAFLPDGGYWIIVSINDDLCIDNAMPTNSTIEYNLHVGSNLISFPSEGSAAISSAIPNDVESSISGIIAEGGAALHTENGWVGSVSAFEGGNGYWMITTENILFSFNVSTHGRINTHNPIGLIFPEGFEVLQSTRQAFYFVEDISLDGNTISNEGWVLSYQGNTLVGARKWTSNMIDIPVMGYDGNQYSAGYAESGDIPNFKYLDHDTGKLTNLYSKNTPQWENNGIYILGNLDARNVIPQGMMLNVYPNPFNPSTTLSFSIPDESMVQLSIYNISGQLISELTREFQTPGMYDYKWDASAYPSGIYFAKLNFNDTFHTQKLILIK